MKLYGNFTSGQLMKIINILRNNEFQSSLFLKSAKRLVSGIRLGIRVTKFAFVKIIEFFRVFHEKRMANYINRTKGYSAVLIINAVPASKIRNTTFRRYTRTS